MKQELLTKIAAVESIAKASPLRRLLRNPFRYGKALGFNRLIYPRQGRKFAVTAVLFWGKKMQVALPASTDIYLTGGKSHPSEIRLAKFLIQHLNEGDHFLDIGAHYGYFTLLANELVGARGRIVSCEPATESFQILQRNAAPFTSIRVVKKAVSDVNGDMVFYEFPNQYSEYNALDVAQFKEEAWFREARPVEVKVPSTTIDDICRNESLRPAMIKIDVEGGELSAIRGGMELLNNSAPTIAMEYLEPKRNNTPHQEATAVLKSLGYHTYIINDKGALEPLSDIDDYLVRQNLESDNVIFRKS